MHSCVEDESQMRGEPREISVAYFTGEGRGCKSKAESRKSPKVEKPEQ